MIITKTPFRMSFFGGGTDMEEFFIKEGGAVISTTIDKYCYVNVRHLPPFFEYKTELAYSKIERVKNIEEIEHPAIKNAMKKLDMKDIRLADEAIYLERVLCNEAGGWQDQIAASFGGLNRINFNKGGYEVHPIIISPDRKEQLNNNLMMFFTGFTRFSSDIQNENKDSNKEKKEEKLKIMYELVDDAEKILTNSKSDLDEFGKLLDYTWNLKRQTGKAVSTENIDEIYNKGIKAGALGGKLLGAGGGGFLVFYVQPEKQESVKKAMKDFLYIPFKFENEGTRVIHYTPENYEPIIEEDKQ